MGTPENTIKSPNYSEQALEERTRAFLAEGGPWERLVAAKDALVELVNGEFLSQGSYQSVSESPLMKFVPNEDCRLVSLYEGLDLDHALDLMIWSYGFSGEFQNGPAGAVNFFLKSSLNQMSLVESVATVVESFDAPVGELSKGKRTAPITSKMNLPMNENGLPAENKREALVRCADEIEKWTAANAAAVSDPVLEQIASALVQYRAALPEVFEYVDYAKEFIKRTKATPQTTIKSPDFSQDALKERTDCFIAEGGPWKRYIRGLDNLKYIITLNTHPPENYQGLSTLPPLPGTREEWWALGDLPINPHLKLYRPDYVPVSHGLSDDETYHASGEILLSEIFDRLGNGPLRNIQFDFDPFDIVFDEASQQRKKQPKPIEYERAAGGLVEVFRQEYFTAEMRQKLEETIQSGGALTSIKPPFYRGITYRWEEFRENPREIGRWLEANRLAIPESDQRLMEEQIKACSDAYAEVLDYVSYAQGYLAHHSGKDKRNEIKIGG